MQVEVGTLKYGTQIVLFISRFLGPNLLFVAMLLTAVAYYQSSVTDAPTWRNVAAGSMALVGTLAGLGYRDFVGRMRKFEAQIKHDQDKRDVQHKANVAAIVALAMVTADHLKEEDKEKIQSIVKTLGGD